ncbi:unnamed protein product [Chrysoparadoxa australica]
MSSEDDGRVLLPSCVQPLEYKLRLEPDLVKFVFKGTEVVHVNVVSATQTLTLHSKEISIHEASFTGSDGVTIAATSLSFDLKLTTLELGFGVDLPLGEGDLNIEFTGCLNNQMTGFYRSGYETVTGEKRIMASTQFEALDARRCFPCWDEPAAKAVFEVTMVIPPELQAISNMPEAECGILLDGRREIAFMPSPKMSTYLLAFCVGEFDFVQGITAHGVLIRVFTPPGKRELGRFALEVAKDTLDLYDDFFKVPYPLPKLDMIAIPEFAMGAMENWGLVTYREVDVLLDENKASTQQRQRVASVIAHELAHQWFGNLVTMKWWRALYLNEGFASWTQTFALACLFPGWGMWEQFTVDDQAAALRLDSLRSSHPIEVPIVHAEEVEQVFDAISYCKGACLVKMAHAVLGADKFQEGLQVYMDRHKYGNTETSDLWNAWETVSGLPIQKMLGSWTDQMGHPVVKVVKEEWGADSVKLSLEQEWFLADGSVGGPDEQKLWTIPLLYSTPTTTASPQMELMSELKMDITIPLASKDDWVKLNAGQETLMRTQNTPEMWRRLQQAVSSKQLPAQDRAGLINDAYALAKAERIKVEVLLGLLGAFKGEDNSTVWEALAVVLVGLDKVLVAEDRIYPFFLKFALQLIMPAATMIGWDPKPDDGHLSKLLRGTMVGLLSRFAWQAPEVQAEASKRFSAYCSDPSNQVALPSEYVAPVYKIVLKSGGEEEFAKVKALWSRAETNIERKQVYTAIGSAASVALKQQVMEWAMSSEVKLQDFFYLFGSVSSSGKAGQDVAWDFFRSRLSDLKAKLAKAVPSLMDACILNCCSGFALRSKADEVIKFFKENPMPQNERKIAQMTESMLINARFLERIQGSDLVNESFWAGII